MECWTCGKSTGDMFRAYCENCFAAQQTAEKLNKEIETAEEELALYVEVDFEYGTATHRRIENLERKLENLYAEKKALLEN
jgi:NMD protein affecting ribosome stability and mRNA decay